MKKDIKAKLKAYSGMAGGLLAAGAVQGQVAYTNINPDTILSGNESYFLDLNNDGTADFEMIHFNTTYSGSKSSSFYMGEGIHALNGNEVFYTSYVTKLNQGDSINDQAPFNGSSYQLMFLRAVSYSSGTNTSSSGPWGGAQDKYVGFRIQISGQWHYGWARCDASPLGDTLIIKDYAYNTVPGAPILAGDTSGTVGISSFNPLKKLRIHSTEGMFKLFNADLYEGNILEVVDMQGKIVMKEEIAGNKNTFRHSLEEGVYVIRIRSEKTYYTQRKRLF